MDKFIRNKFNNSHFGIWLAIFVFGILFVSFSYTIDSKEDSKVNHIGHNEAQEIPKSLLPSLAESLGAVNSQYHIFEHQDIYTSKTPNHGIITTFHKDRVKFGHGNNVVGMRLVSKNRNVEPVKVSNNKIEYQRGNITEWYVNSPYGMEQGFTLDKKPQGTENEVSVSIGLDLEDGVKAIDRKSGKSIQFVDSDENYILNYSGLYAFDSTGKELPSSLSLKENDIIQINVDDRNAQYPITIDPFIEAQRVTAADPTSGAQDDFALSVSIDGDRAIVGIPGWDGAAGSGQGAVIIYERNGAGVWVATPTLFSPDPGSSDDFGTAVAISGDWALIGEPDADNGATNDGTAHFFMRSAGGAWTHQQTVFHAPGTQAESFGISVSILGDRAVVGDPGYELAVATRNSGAIFIYERSGATWNPVAGNPILTSDSARNDEFGTSVSISGDWVIAGAPGDSSGSGFSTITHGSIYFLQRVAGTWTEIQKVIGVADSEFGAAVAIDGTIAIAGAQGEVVTGGSSINAGAVYIFERSGTDWTIGSAMPDVTTTETRITASDQASGDRFGVSVSIFGDMIVVGATGQDLSISGDGSAYVYQRSAPGVWGNEQQIFASDPSLSAIFGQSVSISGDTILVGSPQADEGTSPDPVVSEQGAGYFFGVSAMLTIEKESNPDGGTGFGFTGTGFPSTCGLDGSFTLDDDNSGGTSFIDCDVLPGAYTVQETDPNGHALTDINCAGTTDFTETADSVTVNLIEDDMVVCTFTNTRTRTLSVTVIGSGTVAATGISCPGDCTEDYTDGTVVALTPTPSAGFIFDSWSGDADCTDGSVTMNGARSCTASFVAIPMRNLDVSISPTGGGTVAATGIACPGDCTEDYEQGTVVALTPTPSAGFIFDSWTGTGCTTGSVTMSEDRSCTANFVEQFTLTTSVVGSGSIAATGIACPGDCTEDYNTGTVVALTPTPAAGFVFDSWSGDADCSDGSVTMSADRSCTATFIEQFTLTTSVVGSGSIAATGIACPGDCTEDYNTGTVVALTPTPDTGFVFDGWTGDTDCSDGSVTMSADRSCTATFIEQFTLTTSVVGSGSIAATGIACPGDCTEDYNTGTVVALTPTPDAGFVFDGWTGDTDCTDGSVTMNGARSCTANFVVEQFTLDINLSPNDGGTVAATGIACPGDCTEDYNTGSSIALTPTANAGFVFDGWTGAGCATGTVAMTQNRTCTANFSLQISTVFITEIIGSGNIISNPPGIDCGVDCDADFPNGTIVDLTPIPAPGFIFDSWDGDPDCLDGSITIDENDKACTAVFIVDSQIVLLPLFPALANNVNTITAEGVDGKVAFLWSFQAGSTIVNGPTCNGLELGIRNPRVLSIVDSLPNGTAEFDFFIPNFGDSNISFLTQAVNISNCDLSDVVSNIIRKL